MSTITCNEEMKDNAKCKKNLVLSHPLGDLGVTYTVHLWLDGKRVVDFLLELIELFFASSYGWGAMSKYWSKLRCLKGVGHFERKFPREGGHPPTSFGVRKLDSLGYHVVLFVWSYV